MYQDRLACLCSAARRTRQARYDSKLAKCDEKPKEATFPLQVNPPNANTLDTQERCQLTAVLVRSAPELWSAMPNLD